VDLGRDTSKIELIAEDGTTTSSRSFGGTANFFQLIPAQFRNLFIFLTGSIVIVLMVSRTTMLGAMLGVTLVAPAVILSLFGLSKEILVFCMSTFIVLLYNSNQSSMTKIVSTVLLYLIYGFTVRSYYFLIITAYVVILLWTTRITELRIVIVGMAAITIMLMPDEAFHVLQSARDASIAYLKYTSPHVFAL
jgi:hypothetical protein